MSLGFKSDCTKYEHTLGVLSPPCSGLCILIMEGRWGGVRVGRFTESTITGTIRLKYLFETSAAETTQYVQAISSVVLCRHSVCFFLCTKKLHVHECLEGCCSCTRSF